MRFNPLTSRALLLALLILTQILPPTVARAQNTTSFVKGIVHGDNNEPLNGATVIIRNNKTNFTSGTKTDSSGIFTFRVLAGGPYGFTVSMVGYEAQNLSGYSLKEGATFSLIVCCSSIG